VTLAGQPTSTRVRRRIGLAVPALSSRFGQLVQSPELATLFPDYLVLQHTVIRASVPLMQDAADRLASFDPGDRLAADLRSYLVEHIREEAGHDEWLLEDLEVLGVGREQVLAATPSPHVAAAVGAQYYWIRHHHPVAVLGYIAVLEGHPPSLVDVQGWRERTGLPAGAFRTLEQHAGLDPSHNQDLDALLDTLALDEDHLRAICVNGLATVRSLAHALDGLLDPPQLRHDPRLAGEVRAAVPGEAQTSA